MSFVSTNNSKGAVLLAVLVVAVVMVVLMSVASKMLQGRIELAQNSKQQVYDHAVVFSKRSELIYLLSTQRQTVAGISTGKVKIDVNPDNPRPSFLPIGDEIRIDGFQYTEKSGLSFVIQNDNGLLPMNSRGQFWLKLWLGKQGYLPSKISMYADLLADYADADNKRRASGGEVSSYSEQTPFLPRNFLLQSCSELMLIKEWGELLLENNSLIHQCSLRRGPFINLNAIPEQLWRKLWPASVNRVMQHRKNNSWLLSNTDILKLEPSLSAFSDDYYSISGGTSFRVTIKMNAKEESFILHIGSGSAAPYEIN